MKKEESQIFEKAEGLRQLILSSSLKPSDITKLDAQLDGIIHNMAQKYDSKYEDLNKVGNV